MGMDMCNTHFLIRYENKDENVQIHSIPVLIPVSIFISIFISIYHLVVILMEKKKSTTNLPRMLQI